MLFLVLLLLLMFGSLCFFWCLSDPCFKNSAEESRQIRANVIEFPGAGTFSLAANFVLVFCSAGGFASAHVWEFLFFLVFFLLRLFGNPGARDDLCSQGAVRGRTRPRCSAREFFPSLLPSQISLLASLRWSRISSPPNVGT